MEAGTVDLVQTTTLRKFTPDDLDFLRRAIRACNYGEVTVTVPQALVAIELGQLDYYIANDRCGGGVWWKNDEQAWLVLLYREGEAKGLRTDCLLLRQGLEESLQRHVQRPVRLYAAIDAGNPRRKQLLFLYEKIYGVREFQTVARSDWIR